MNIRSRMRWSSLTTVAKVTYSTIMLVAALATILTFVWVVNGWPHKSDEGVLSGTSNSRHTPRSTVVARGASQPTSGRVTHPAATWDAGRCMAADETPLRCDAPHDGEIYAIGASCDKERFIFYAGGDPALEVLGSLLQFSLTDDSTACKVTGLPRTGLRTSTSNLFNDSRGDVLRRCVDGRNRREVPCSVSHLAEYVLLRAKSDSLDESCATAAEVYIGDLSTELLSQIRVVQGAVGGDMYCTAEVRGTNVLTGSLRTLGDRSLPISGRLQE